MKSMAIADSVRAIGRAGAGTNNIPVKAMSERGVPVFNAPGANANAVKELVLAGMLMAARNLVPAVRFVGSLNCDDETLAKRVEAEKKQFAGIELPQQTLGVIGLGKIGSLVADAAIKLGMNVLGYDPEITVEAAWSLPSQVKKAHSIEEILKASQFVTLHVPLLPVTRHLIGAKNLELMHPGSILLNFSREEIVDANVPNMVGQISGAMAKAGLNIHNMINRSKGEMAYTLVDVDSPVNKALIDGLARIKGVLAVRYLPLS